MADIKELLSQMTIEEKASLCSGLGFWETKPVERLNIPKVMMTDGPHGLRREVSTGGGVNVMKGSAPSTCFPTAVTSASTWDKDLLRKMGEAIGNEALNQNVSTVLGPGVNIKRSPLCGRNFEYFSEDPFLAAEMATNYVQGLQSTGVGTSLKHYCGNNQEHNRMSCDSIIDERTLREIYLPAFEKTVKRAQPYQIMCSYNLLNGTYLSDNKRMLTDILRDEWGFKGLVVSDWGAVNDRVEGVKAGLDLEMPGNKGMTDKNIVKAVKSGKLSEANLDLIVERVLNYVFKCAEHKKPDMPYDYEISHKLAKQIASNGAVLLKNDDNILPVNASEKVAVIGRLAKEVRYQGSGSSRINPYHLTDIMTSLNELGLNAVYADGYTIKGDGYNKKLLEEAVELAKTVDKVVLVIGLTDVYESEGFDRTHLDLPLGHNKLVKEVAKVNPNVIVLLQGGSPVILPWHKKVKAILNCYLGGEAAGEAAAELLTGKVNPSGKLAETYPKSLSDTLSSTYFPMGPRTVEYRESIYVGYRWFDAAEKPVRYPFGYGLSYTTFEYSDINLNKSSIGESDVCTVSFTITNTGNVDGAEIAQLYIKPPKSKIYKAVKELKGFEKVFIKAGESKSVTITFNEDGRAFSFFNAEAGCWQAESGKYGVLIGASSRDIKLETEIEVISNNPELAVPSYETTAPSYYKPTEITSVPVEEYEALCGKKMVENTPYKRGEFTVNCTVTDVAVCGWGKALKNVLTFGAKIVAIGSSNPDMIIKSVLDMPLRGFCGFSGGVLSQMTVEGMVDVFNKTKGGRKKFWAGFKKKNK